METYSEPMREGVAAEVAALPTDELALLLCYFYQRGGPGLELVQAEYDKRILHHTPTTR